MQFNGSLWGFKGLGPDYLSWARSPYRAGPVYRDVFQHDVSTCDGMWCVRGWKLESSASLLIAPSFPEVPEIPGVCSPGDFSNIGSLK